jgi:hydroxyacylglutathione hydrolase
LVNEFLPDISRQLRTLDRKMPLAVYCDSGYRAAIANGFDLSNVPGNWQAWTARGLPVEVTAGPARDPK